MTTFLHSHQIREITEVHQTQILSLRHSESSKGDKNEEEISGGKIQEYNKRSLSKDSWCSNEGLKAVVEVVFKMSLTQVEVGTGNAAKRNRDREQGPSFPGSTDLYHLLWEALGTQW